MDTDWSSTEALSTAATTAKKPASEVATGAREVLVFTQDPELRSFIRKSLYAGTLASTTASSQAEIAACLARGSYGLLVVGIDSPESLESLYRTHQAFPKLPIVAVARIAGPELVRDIMRAGAIDFLFGSFSTKKFVARMSAILDSGEDTTAVERKATTAPVEASSAPSASDAGSNPEADAQIVYCSGEMKRILEIVETVGPTESTVLVQGESGTGKELIAKRIHRLSKRSAKPFVEVNCGAMPENLLESQLFGHEKGSFTGAVHRQIGLFEIADGGTIFLDEVGETSLDMQVKLLRVLQFQEFRRVGGSDEIKVDVRVVAATNKNVAEEVEKERFRSDLFYRLNVICLDIPPLRERLEEIPDLVALFSGRFAQVKGLQSKTFSSEAIEKLQKYRWTGNIRELENAVERLMLLAKATIIEVDDLEEHLGQSTEMNFPSVFAPTLTLDEVKRIHIANVLRENAGNKMKTARILKINVKTLYNLIKSLDINI